MPVRIAISGFGRIGRNVLRALAEAKRRDLEVVAINDLASAKDNAHLFKYDSVHGPFPGTVKVEADSIDVGTGPIKVLAERDPKKLPWKSLGIDVVMECTGVPAVIRDCLGATAACGIVCLAGLSEAQRIPDLDVGRLNRTMVLDNDAVFGTVNANRRHYEEAARVLEDTDRSWLEHLVDRRVPLDRWEDAYRADSYAVKTIIELQPSQ